MRKPSLRALLLRRDKKPQQALVQYESVRQSDKSRGVLPAAAATSEAPGQTATGPEVMPLRPLSLI